MDSEEARRFFGILPREAGVTEIRRHGLFAEDSADRVLAALRSLGHRAAFHPVESPLPEGVPPIGLVRTLRSPWSQLLEPETSGFLDESLARALSNALGSRTVSYDYDFPRSRFRHVLWSAGEAALRLELESLEATFPERCQEFFRVHRLREWGLTVLDLSCRRIPFPPTILVESYFIRLDGPVRRDRA